MIAIEGIAGSGKTLFSRFFLKETGIASDDPDYSLDAYDLSSRCVVSQNRTGRTVVYRCRSKSYFPFYEQCIVVTKSVARHGRYHERGFRVFSIVHGRLVETWVSKLFCRFE